MEIKQAEQKQHHDQSTKLRCLFPGSLVVVRNYCSDVRCITGTVFRKLGPITSNVDIGKGRIVKRYVDQLRQWVSSTLLAQSMPESTSQSPIADNYYYLCEVDISAPQPEPEAVLRQILRQAEQEPRYPPHQHHPPDRSINIMGEEMW